MEKHNEQRSRLNVLKLFARRHNIILFDSTVVHSNIITFLFDLKKNMQAKKKKGVPHHPVKGGKHFNTIGPIKM